jgi:hypothetical protein
MEELGWDLVSFLKDGPFVLIPGSFLNLSDKFLKILDVMEYG